MNDNESGFSNTVAATPAAGVLTSPYLAGYLYDDAGNRTAKYTLSGGSSYAVDDENRLTSESPFASQVLVPATTTVQDNWVELDFGAPVSVFRLDVSLPDLNRRFKIQSWDGAAYQDISSLSALGANLESDGWYRPFSSGFSVLCSIFSSKVRYFQESGSSAGVSLVAYTMVAGTPVVYGHDANGNQTSRTQGSLVETFAHDYANRIVTYSDQQAAYSYIFAPSGERMAKVNPDLSSEWYMYDGDDVVADYAKPSGGQYSLTATYANGLGIDSKICKYDPAGAASYYISDALGSVHKILDGSQNVVNTYLTNAWGESLIAIEGQNNRYGFTQRERDPESSLMHYRARSYDPRLGRFVQKDPLGMTDGPNVYAYIDNNPVISTDPSGRKIAVKASEGDLKTILSRHSISGYSTSKLKTEGFIEATGSPMKITHGSDNNLATEIYWRMLISPRQFNFNSTSEMEFFVKAQLNIVRAAKSAQFSTPGKNEEVTLPQGWLTPTLFTDDLPVALTQWFGCDPQNLRTGCTQGTAIVALYGVYRAMGNKRFSNYVQPGASLETVEKNFFAVPFRNVSLDDWIPGEWGYIKNLKNADDPGYRQGENILYLGGTFKTRKSFFREHILFWGMGAGRVEIMSLMEWVTKVARWTDEGFRFGEGNAFNLSAAKTLVELPTSRKIIRRELLKE